MSWLSASIQTLEALDHGQDPLAQVTTYANADGTIAARVLPIHPYERLLFNGITADVWMQPGVTAENLRETTAGFYREKNPIGSVTLVLGAGNVSSIVPLDILDRRSAGGPG